MKKTILIFFIFFIIVILIFSCFLFRRKVKTEPDKIDVKKEFCIERIIYYSSANAISNTTNYQNPEWNLKIYQYTDIAIYINRPDNIDTAGYITEISLKNFKTDLENVKVYYLNPNDFGNSVLNSDNSIENELQYTVVNSKNTENIQNYNIPIFFQDCSNPITLRIVTELSNNYKVPNNHTLIYNGNLIKEVGLGVSDLNQRVSFDLIINSKNFKHIENINLEIPYEEEEKSILDGDIKIEKIENIVF